MLTSIKFFRNLKYFFPFLPESPKKRNLRVIFCHFTGTFQKNNAIHQDKSIHFKSSECLPAQNPACPKSGNSTVLYLLKLWCHRCQTEYSINKFTHRGFIPSSSGNISQTPKFTILTNTPAKSTFFRISYRWDLFAVSYLLRCKMHLVKTR